VWPISLVCGQAQHGIRARAKRKFKATTDSRHNLPVAANLIARDFAPAAPDAVWTTDITYIATDEQAPLTADDMHSSMSRKADCRDNAPTESLWGSLKRARLHGRRFETMPAAQWEVMDWLAFYNATRLHSTLGYVSPMQHERNRLAAQEKKSA